jgi:hypothetical protein
MHTLTLVGDPNDGTHGLYMNGVLICDSGDADATLNSPDLDFWRDALDAAITALGGELDEQTRYRPSRKDGAPFEEEWESFWPEKLENMGPIEEVWGPIVPGSIEAEEIEKVGGESANPDWIF